jgi:DNA polymerase-3 subunit alpha
MVSSLIRKKKQDDAEQTVKRFMDIFGDDYYLEIQRHPGIAELDTVNKSLILLSRKFGIPLVATNDVHYLNKEDAYAQEILLCIQTQHTILEKNRPISMIDSPDFYFKSSDELSSVFADLPEAIENTNKIADKCNVEIEIGKWIMPQYVVPEGLSPAEELKQQVRLGIPRRYKEVTPEIAERIEYELSVIIKKKYETYFLVVSDFVNWAKKQGILVGPGRGSAAGSVVSYILNITDVDPFFFKLPFARFLIPDRPSAPDIDLDFADIRRDEVIAYVTKKYGEDKVAQIITFGTMEARGSVRDAGRALGMSYSGPDRISRMIPPGWQGHAMTIDLALKQSPDLKKAYETEEETKTLLDIAKKLEGIARHASVHAAGVVIADKPLTEYTPLQRETKGDKVITQYDMYTVGEDGVGLLKMDFLGLRNLTIIEKTLHYIKENRNLTIDLTSVDLHDKKTFDLLSEGETTGIFQLESAGMRRYIKELKPSSIFDLQAMVALYRPGPMANIPEFIKRKHNPSLIKFPDPRLKDILQQSYGVLTYQDDVLLTAITLAGYSWLEADKFRKAMGKKIPSEMKKQRELFIKGCVENGLTPRKAEEFFDLIAPFAGYGFNKAHAACYATIAFRTAYLKANFTVEFMTALLTAESDGASGSIREDKLRYAIEECRKIKIPVLSPDINNSLIEFSVENKTSIRFGLSAVKNVGSAAISAILAVRSEKPFASVTDFVSRVDLSKVNKKTLESLIKVGAFDSFGSRASLLTGIGEVVAWAQKNKKNVGNPQESLFGEVMDDEEPTFPKVEDFTKRELLNLEKDLLGFYLTEHPLESKMQALSGQNITTISDCATKEDGKKVRVPVLVTRIKNILTKKNNSEMIFATLEDMTGTIDGVVFPTTYAKTKSFWYKDATLLVSGSINRRDDKLSLLVDNIYPLDV